MAFKDNDQTEGKVAKGIEKQKAKTPSDVFCGLHWVQWT